MVTKSIFLLKPRHVFLFHIILLFSLIQVEGCVPDITVVGSGNVTSKTPSLSKFSNITFSHPGKVEITKGTSSEIKIEEYENIFQYLTTNIDNGTLNLGTTPNVSIINSVAKIFITTPDEISSISVTGSGEISLKSSFSNITKAQMTGSGSITPELASTTPTIEMVVTGSGNLDFSKIEAAEVNCTITGSGTATVYATKTLNANITGSGNIYYYGSPTLNVKSSGTGKVIKK